MSDNTLKLTITLVTIASFILLTGCVGNLHLTDRSEAKALLKNIDKICLVTNYSNSVLKENGEPIDVLDEHVKNIEKKLKDRDFSIEKHIEKNNSKKFHDWSIICQQDPSYFKEFDRSKSDDCDATYIVLFDASDDFNIENPYVSYAFALLSDHKRIFVNGYWWDQKRSKGEQILEPVSKVLFTPIVLLPFSENRDIAKKNESIAVIFQKALSEQVENLSTTYIDVMDNFSK